MLVLAVKIIISLRKWSDIMIIKCPYCGSKEYECFDTCGGDGDTIQELYTCFDCDKQFSAIYVFDRIEKES